MNRKKWQAEKDPTKLMLKLCEEVGEVVHAFNEDNAAHTRLELRHVELITKRLREVL